MRQKKEMANGCLEVSISSSLRYFIWLLKATILSQPHWTRKQPGVSLCLAGSPHGRGDQNDSIPTHKQHRDVPLGRLVHLLVGLLIDLYDSDSLLDLAENH